jgi:hypothetical protein
MAKVKFATLALALGLTASVTALADHNSVWGEGWASMPNDIHNTRLDVDDTDDFIDFVRMGSGADSVNRFLTDDNTDTVGAGSVNRQGASRGGRS